ncbi:MAG: HupE/UreJ family protein [Acidimicrobiia bacterium]|nr:HupE/UreJ family protein [Acidimicrobiia bacterium]NNF09426.1 HupE/UreJ family protein [Acidimicrobiia bacterium]
MTKRVMRGATVMVLTVIAATLVMAGVAGAHQSGENYLYLDIFDSEIDGEIHYPVEDLNEVLGADIPDDADGAKMWAEANPDLIHDYSAAHIAMSGLDGSSWPIVFGDFDGLEGADGAYLIAAFDVDREFEEVPRQFVVTYDAIVHAKPERAALLAIATDFGSGTFNNEADMLLRYSPNNVTQTVDLGDTSFFSGVTAVIELGVEHIRIGTDHILFILALVLPSVLIFGRAPGWQPSPSFGASLWRVLKIVTMFTVAHTITLTLGGLGIVELPSALVETAIAISIILAALHNIRPVFVNKEWLIAFSFGLIHGFGFAGLLSDLGLTQSRRLVSLLGFNIGIEIGQAVIIVLVFPALYLARRTKGYLPAMYGGSLLLILIASVWAIERAFSVDLGTEWIMDRASVWPRQLIPVAIAYVLATVAYRKGRNNGELLPLPEAADSSILAPQPAEA